MAETAPTWRSTSGARTASSPHADSRPANSSRLRSRFSGAASTTKPASPRSSSVAAGRTRAAVEAALEIKSIDFQRVDLLPLTQIVVGPDAVIRAYVVGSRDELKPGANIGIVAAVMGGHFSRLWPWVSMLRLRPAAMRAPSLVSAPEDSMASRPA